MITNGMEQFILINLFFLERETMNMFEKYFSKDYVFRWNNIADGMYTYKL